MTRFHHSSSGLGSGQITRASERDCVRSRVDAVDISVAGMTGYISKLANRMDKRTFVVGAAYPRARRSEVWRTGAPPASRRVATCRELGS